MITNPHSPLQNLKANARKQIKVKRDDLIDPFISGNKWRKLKYLLEKAEVGGKNHLVTFGGAFSNHLVATAAAASRMGLRSTGFVRGECIENEILLLCKLFGMGLIFVSRTEYQKKQELYDRYFKDNQETMFIDEGGASAEAVRGCAEIIYELPSDIDHIFCAAGTGTTAAGLLAGIYERGLKTHLHVISVLRAPGFIAKAIGSYVNNFSQLTIHEDYHFGGYAKTTPELIDYIKDFIAIEGMLIDPVYTAKMFFAIDDLKKKNHVKEREQIIALHTGGSMGLFGMASRF